MATISSPLNEQVENYRRAATIDNTGIVERKIAPRVRKFVIPRVTEAFRTTRLPSGLDFQEKKFRERVEWSRSKYLYDLLIKESEAFMNIQDALPYSTDVLADWSHPWKASSSYELDLSLERNRRSMSKGAGLPTMGSKKDALSDAMLYFEKVKQNPVLEMIWSILFGYRTQQSDTREPKIRLIWGTSIIQWLFECMAVDSALTLTQESVSPKLDVFVFYTEPSQFQEWVRAHSDRVVEYVSLDASQFDSSVTASELHQMVSYFCPDFEFKDLIISMLQRADILMPEGVLSREGGMPSGTKFTNLGDGFCNVCDILTAFGRYKLDRYIESIAVNGDDITVGLSTKLSGENLDKISHASLRNISPDKSYTGANVWNSKWYIDDDIMTRPIWRVINSTMYSERMKSAIFGSKEYIELALAAQLKDIEQHPCSDVVIDTYAKYVTKYHISTMDNEQLQDAAEAYIDAHSWRAEFLTPKDLLEQLRSSKYGQAFV